VKDWYGRPIFFVSDAEESVEFYRDKLDFSLDWRHDEEDRAYVCQVSRNGFELILQKDSAKAGKGRVFISLDSEQNALLNQEITERGINAEAANWGMPITKIVDLDGNELFISFDE
jgi:catechol 2,3-dioxygenase-like lactoylglutathione lyase family enzyme